jgi:hypothetical protein
MYIANKTKMAVARSCDMGHHLCHLGMFCNGSLITNKDVDVAEDRTPCSLVISRLWHVSFAGESEVSTNRSTSYRAEIGFLTMQRRSSYFHTW